MKAELSDKSSTLNELTPLVFSHLLVKFLRLLLLGSQISCMHSMKSSRVLLLHLNLLKQASSPFRKVAVPIRMISYLTKQAPFPYVMPSINPSACSLVGQSASTGCVVGAISSLYPFVFSLQKSIQPSDSWDSGVITNSSSGYFI